MKMKYTRRIVGYTLTDHKTNTEIEKKRIKHNPSFRRKNHRATREIGYM
jgi:hypothetical protein